MKEETVWLRLTPQELKTLRGLAFKGLTAAANGFLNKTDEVYELARSGAVMVKIEEEYNKHIAEPEEAAEEAA